jgi:hypothetical protein
MSPLKQIVALLIFVSAVAALYRRTWRILREAEQREAARVKHEAIMHEIYFRRMDTACTDGETCDLCGAVSKVREMVDLADDVVLLCLGCAPMLRRRAGTVTHD